MTYSPQTWVDDVPVGTGTPLDAAHLNHIEAGIAAAIAAPAGVVGGEVAVWDAGSSSWVRSSVTKIATGQFAGIKNADVDAAAGIGLAKLAITGTPTGSKFLRDDGSWQLVPAPATYRKTSTFTLSNTVSELDILNSEITLAANVLSTDRFVRGVAHGDYINNTGSNQAGIRFKLKLGATLLFDTGVIAGSAIGTDAVRRPWTLNFGISEDGANVQKAWWRLEFNPATVSGTLAQGMATGTGYWGPTAQSGFFWVSNSTSGATETTSGALAITLLATLPVASANFNMTLKSALVVVE